MGEGKRVSSGHLVLGASLPAGSPGLPWGLVLRAPCSALLRSLVQQEQHRACPGGPDGRSDDPRSPVLP